MNLDEHLSQLVESAVTKALSAWTPPSAPSPGDEPQRLLTVDQAAALLAVSSPSIRRLIDSGQLRATRVLGSVRISREDLDRFIDSARGGGDE